MPSRTSFFKNATLFGATNILDIIDSNGKGVAEGDGAAADLEAKLNKDSKSISHSFYTPTRFRPPALNFSSMFPRHVEKHKLYAIISEGYSD